LLVIGHGVDLTVYTMLYLQGASAMREVRND